MKNPVYLSLSRHNVFYFRYPIPANLHPRAKQTDIRLSLETRCPKTALQMVRSLVYFAEGIMRNPVIKIMDYDEIRDVLTEFFKNAREKTKERIAKYGQLQEQDIRSLNQTYDLATQALEDNDFSLIGDATDLGSVIRANSLSLEEGSEGYELFRTSHPQFSAIGVLDAVRVLGIYRIFSEV